MAKIRKRILPSGETRWLADYVDATGKRRAKQFDRRKAAEAYLDGVKYDLRHGRHVAPGASITVAMAGELWIERASRDQLVRSTVRQYRQHLDHHIGPDLGTPRPRPRKGRAMPSRCPPKRNCAPSSTRPPAAGVR